MKTDANFLSGGQRQALTLAMATLVRPKILLLDEHTAALDPKTSDMVMNLTRKIVEEQKVDNSYDYPQYGTCYRIWKPFSYALSW